MGRTQWGNMFGSPVETTRLCYWWVPLGFLSSLSGESRKLSRSLLSCQLRGGWEKLVARPVRGVCKSRGSGRAEEQGWMELSRGCILLVRKHRGKTHELLSHGTCKCRSWHWSLGLCGWSLWFHVCRGAGPPLKACLPHHLLPLSQDPSEKYVRAWSIGEHRLAEKQLGFPLNFELSPVLLMQQ